MERKTNKSYDITNNLSSWFEQLFVMMNRLDLFVLILDTARESKTELTFYTELCEESDLRKDAWLPREASENFNNNSLCSRKNVTVVNKNELRLLKTVVAEKIKMRANLPSVPITKTENNETGNEFLHAHRMKGGSVLDAGHAACPPKTFRVNRIRFKNGLPELLKSLDQAVSLIHYVRCCERRFYVATRIPEPTYYLPEGAIRCGERLTVSLLNPSVYHTNDAYLRIYFLPSKKLVQKLPFRPSGKGPCKLVLHELLQSKDEATSLLHWLRCCKYRLTTKTHIPKPTFTFPLGTVRFAERQTVLREKPFVLKFRDDYRREEFMSFSGRRQHLWDHLPTFLDTKYNAVMPKTGYFSGRTLGMSPRIKRKRKLVGFSKPLEAIEEVDSETNSREDIVRTGPLANSAKGPKSNTTVTDVHRSKSGEVSFRLADNLCLGLPATCRNVVAEELNPGDAKETKGDTSGIVNKASRLNGDGNGGAAVRTVSRGAQIIKQSKVPSGRGLGRFFGMFRFSKHEPLPPIPKGRRLSGDSVSSSSTRDSTEPSL